MALSENPTFANMTEILEMVEVIIPEEIRKKYCVGQIWEQIIQQKQRGPDETMQKPMSFISLKQFLAAYLVNMVVQALFQELALGMKIDPQTREFINLSVEEIKTIEKTIRSIVEFVKNDLEVAVRIDPEINQPYVQI